MKYVRIHVLPEDIERATQNHCQKCPVALAIARYLPGMTASVVSFAAGIVDAKGMSFQASLPRWVGDRVWKYDSGRGMTPFEFDIEVPDDLEVSY